MVYDEPKPDTDVIAELPASPQRTRVKSVASTPVTGSLKATAQETDDAFVGFDPDRLIDDT